MGKVWWLYIALGGWIVVLSLYLSNAFERFARLEKRVDELVPAGLLSRLIPNPAALSRQRPRIRATVDAARGAPAWQVGTQFTQR